MKLENLLKSQYRELEEKFDALVEENDESVRDLTFGDWAEGMTYTDDDFFCTANRHRYYDYYIPGTNKSLTLYEDDLRALEHFRGDIIEDAEDATYVVLALINAYKEKYENELA